jgi:hypothetical protein
MNIIKVEKLKDKPLYLKYTFENGETKILPRFIFELCEFKKVFAVELEPVVKAEQAKEKPSANLLNLNNNLENILQPQLDILLNETIRLREANEKLYNLIQRIEQLQDLKLCKDRDTIIKYDVINKAYFDAAN